MATMSKNTQAGMAATNAAKKRLQVEFATRFEEIVREERRKRGLPPDRISPSSVVLIDDRIKKYEERLAELRKRRDEIQKGK